MLTPGNLHSESGKRMNSGLISRRIVGCVALAGLSACKKAGDVPSGAGRPDAASAAAATTGTENSGTIGGLSDANIFYVLDAVNMGDSTKGVLASTKGTSAEVRGFAKMMVRDHHTLRQHGQDLAKRLGVQPVPTSDGLSAKLDGALSKLNAAAKGRDFDKAYIDHEVASHREILTNMVSAMGATHNSEMKNLIQNGAPVIQAHLDKAEAIQKNLQK